MLGGTPFGGSPNNVKEISPADAQAKLEKGEAVLIDVREPVEFAQIRAKGAKLIPLGTFGRHLGELPTDQDILIICQSGNRSARATMAAMQAGLSRVYNVRGGTSAWVMSRLPTERG